MEKLNSKDLHSNIIYTFILGLLWGIFEILAVKFLVPNNLFLKGLILSGIAVFVLIISKRIIDYRFSLLVVAVIALILIFAHRGFISSVMIAIFAEALIAEIVLSFLKTKSKTAMLSGALIFTYSFTHGLLICPGTLPDGYINYLLKQMFKEIFGNGTNVSIEVVIIFWGVFSLIAGVFSGWFSWIFSKNLNQKSINEMVTSI